MWQGYEKKSSWWAHLSLYWERPENNIPIQQWFNWIERSDLILGVSLELHRFNLIHLPEPPEYLETWRTRTCLSNDMLLEDNGTARPMWMRFLGVIIIINSLPIMIMTLYYHLLSLHRILLLPFLLHCLLWADPFVPGRSFSASSFTHSVSFNLITSADSGFH